MTVYSVRQTFVNRRFCCIEEQTRTDCTRLCTNVAFINKANYGVQAIDDVERFKLDEKNPNMYRQPRSTCDARAVQTTSSREKELRIET